MKLFITVLLISAFVTALPVDEDGERHFWFPDDKGVLRLVDSLAEPESPKFDPDQDIKYFLYTRRNPLEHQEIELGDINSLIASNFDESKPVKFTIHGWDADYTSTTNTLVRDAFLSIDDVNMITVDWGVGAAGGYFASVRNVLAAGPVVAEFVNWIHDMGVPYSSMHIIGHSLGGQMSGIVGRNAQGTVEYITALDPANPSWGPNSERIRKTDGKYVEVLHTDSGILGLTDAVGHNDFYPNSGRSMPGCGGDFECSHSIVRQYFSESIASGGFTSVQCESVAEAMSGVENCAGTATLKMGGASIKPEFGVFGLNTNDASPFSQG